MSDWRRVWTGIVVVACLGLGLGGCASAGKGGEVKAGEGAGVGKLGATDACAMRLHDISGAMLEYWMLNRRLPGKLEELKGLGELDSPLVFACPASGKGYVYTGVDLNGAGADRRLVVYDAEGVHGGYRWGIVAAPAGGGKPLMMWVVPLTEGQLGAFLAAGAGGAGGGK